MLVVIGLKCAPVFANTLAILSKHIFVYYTLINTCSWANGARLAAPLMRAAAAQTHACSQVLLACHPLPFDLVRHARVCAHTPTACIRPAD